MYTTGLAIFGLAHPKPYERHNGIPYVMMCPNAGMWFLIKSSLFSDVVLTH